MRCLLAFGVVLLVIVSGYEARAYNLAGGSSVVVNEHGVNKKVVNGSGVGYFIPTKTAEEWTAFRNNLPTGVTLQEPYTYSWYQSGWSACSATCGGGTQTQTVYCRRSDGTQVADASCSGGKPATSEACNTQACPYKWAYNRTEGDDNYAGRPKCTYAGQTGCNTQRCASSNPVGQSCTLQSIECQSNCDFIEEEDEVVCDYYRCQ